MPNCGRVLVVEDEPISCEVLVDNLREIGCRPIAATDGQSAWSLLAEDPNGYDVVLLDRRLPDMDGLDLLARVKSDPALAHVPVILQTAMDAQQDVLDGLRAGAYYYLTKPIAPETLQAVVDTAVGDHHSYEAMRSEAEKASHALRYLDRAEFSFRSHDEARDIAGLLANACPDGKKVVVGLSELMLNAVEHGNLGITYDEKTRLISEDRLLAEVECRLRDPAYARKKVRVTFQRSDGAIEFVIQDQGKGFDWKPFLQMSPERVFDNHGRGIAMAAILSFHHLEYQGCGNRVLAMVQTENDVES
jgi:DNA-binding response OmpR family regulator